MAVFIDCINGKVVANNISENNIVPKEFVDFLNKNTNNSVVEIIRNSTSEDNIFYIPFVYGYNTNGNINYVIEEVIVVSENGNLTSLYSDNHGFIPINSRCILFQSSDGCCAYIRDMDITKTGDVINLYTISYTLQQTSEFLNKEISNIQNEIAEKQKTLDKYSKMQGDINIALKYIDDKISE